MPELLLLSFAVVGMACVGAGVLYTLNLIRIRLGTGSWPLSTEEEKYIARFAAVEQSTEARLSGVTQRNLLLQGENTRLETELLEAKKTLDDMTKSVIKRIGNR
jgi:hypothetical protein